MHRLTASIVAVTLALTAVACDDPVATTPDPVLVSEVFPIANAEGVSPPLVVGGAATWHFTLATSGTITATITRLEPDATVTVGFALGTWNDASQVCQPVLIRDNAVINTAINGAASFAGTFCVRIYDVGTLTDAVNYVIRVDHP
jgi:hypothetical protein